MTAASLSRLAVIGALAMAFVLAGCGRKGPLDPPPGYTERRVQEQVELQQQYQQQQQQQQLQPPSQWGLFGLDQTVEEEHGLPPQPKGPRKGFLLDWLLN